MDFLSQPLSQLKNLLRSTTPASRAVAGLLLLAVVVGAGYLFTLQGSGGEVYLFEGEKIHPEDLPKMRAAFAQKKLNSYTITGNRIRVPRKELDLYVSALDEANALPGRPGTCLDELLGKTGFFEDSRVTELRKLNARQKELVRILCTWNFIADAAVMIDTEDPRGFGQKKTVTASVSVVPAGSKQLDASQVASIRQFIAGAVAGLKSENVIISDSTGSVDRNDYVALTKTYERVWKAKILGALSFIPGAVVTTNVVLGRQDRPEPPKDDLPSIAADYLPNANVPRSLGPSLGVRSKRKTEPPRPQTDGIPSSETMETVRYTPTRISVSVGVPNSYFVKVWQRRHRAAGNQAPRTPDLATLETIRTEETAKIRSLVATLLPPADDHTDPAGLVNISTFSDFPHEQTAASDGHGGIATWASERPVMLGVLGAALLGLLIAWPLIQTRLAARQPDNGPRILPVETGRNREMPSAERRERENALSVHDELREFVRQDPAAAAEVLNNWIRKAG